MKLSPTHMKLENQTNHVIASNKDYKNLYFRKGISNNSMSQKYFLHINIFIKM